MRRPSFLLLAEKALFTLLIFLVASQLGFHFWLPSSYVFGIRVDYLAPTLYLTDVLVLLLLVLYGFERYLSKKIKLSRQSLLTIFLVLIFASANIVFARSAPAALIKWFKVLELFLLGYYVAKKEDFNVRSMVIMPLLFSGVAFSLIGIVQYLLQHTIGGPLYFFGERTFNAATPGIAKAYFLGKEVMRSYSTFSHPNSYAGFLGIVLISLFFTGLKLRPKGLKIFLVLFLFFALFLTFSRWVFISLLVVGLFYFLEKKKIFSIRKHYLKILISFVALSLLFILLAAKAVETKTPFSESFLERLYWAKEAGEQFVKNPVLGAGLNNYIVGLAKAESPPWVIWKLQPVHNIFLLALSEVGTAGLLALVYLFSVTLKNNRREPRGAYIFCVLMFIIVSGLADHYSLTLQQNQLLLSVFLGLGFRKKQGVLRA